MRAMCPVLHNRVTAGCHYFKIQANRFSDKTQERRGCRSTLPRSVAPRRPNTLPTLANGNVLHLSAMIWDGTCNPFSGVGVTVIRNTCFGRTSLVMGRNVTDSIASYLSD